MRKHAHYEGLRMLSWAAFIRTGCACIPRKKVITLNILDSGGVLPLGVATLGVEECIGESN